MGQAARAIRFFPELLPWRMPDLERHYRAVRAFLGSLTRKDDLADDLTQETYARAYAHLAKHGTKLGDSRPWLFTIAKRTYVDYVRHRVANPARDALSLDWEPVDTRAQRPEQPAYVHEDLERLGDAIEKLDPLSRDLLVGYHLDHEGFADLARRYGVSRTAARVRVFRARRRISKSLLEE